MDQGSLVKVQAKTAAEVCEHYKLSKDARDLLRDGLTPRHFVDLLVQANRYRDAFQFLAHALPRREAVWWACLGIRHAQGSELPPKEFLALKAAVEWVLEPDEPHRRAAQAAGEAADFGTPAGCVAMAVYGSGGSLIPANLPVVPPEPYMTAQAVAGSITMACVQGDPRCMRDLQRELAGLGIEIAEGKITWPTATKVTPRSSASGNRF